jgi:pyruvate dehydrogenase E1 component alpha subunit
MPSEVVDGQDVDAVEAAVGRAVERARSGGGPTLLEAKTYRYYGHSRSDKATYRPEGELEAWLARDPIELLAAKLAERGELAGHGLDDLREQQAQLISEVERRVVESPTASQAQMFANVLAPASS